MSTIYVLTKQGKILKTEVTETVGEIWVKINGEYEANSVFNPNVNREFMLLTDKDGHPLIFHKRYLFKVIK